VFEEKHPDCQALFCFDQSSNHGANAPDALISNRMNLNRGGAHAPVMRDGWFFKNGEKVAQSMNDPTGVPKGIKVVLMERGLWPSGGIRLDCADSCPVGSSSCCARAILAAQADFQAQRSGIAEIVEDAGHAVEFYPKFHCECNFIERVWGEAKRVARAECDYLFGSLLVKVPRILSEIPLAKIRRFQQRAWRYIHAYSLGLSGPLAEWAVTKYRSHRRVQGTMDELLEEMEKEMKTKGK